MHKKPITIVKVAGGYNVFVNDVPIVDSDDLSRGGQDIDRVKAGLKHDGKYKAPKNTEPALIKTSTTAASLAHQVGRYILNMGDLTFSYTQLIGISPEKQERWWSKAIHGK